MCPVHVSDLADQIINQSRRGELLLCQVCGSESSANKADYCFLSESGLRPMSDDFIFQCCGEPLQLVTKRIVYDPVKENQKS
jgi:hypothetical protein